MILLILYILYLIFQLKTHAKLFEGDAEQGPEEGQDDGGRKDGDTLKPIPAAIALVLITVLVAVCAGNSNPDLISCKLFSTNICEEYLVDSIDAIVERAHISRTFIGLILLPIVGNAAEHVTAVVVSWKDKMDLALGVAIGSSMQIALFVTPSLVILGWIIGEKMTLHFQVLETVIFFLSVLVVNYLIQDGRSNYLEGAMCLGT